MPLDPARCHRALATRDPRFDGRFFVGVISTGIYCRPICPARAPKPDHRRFFGTAPEAEAHGFRPCLRCRPELAPGLAQVDAVSRLARTVAARLAAGAADEHGLAALARDLGVSDRHLRRVCEQELGVPPVALAQTHRLLAAKRLLTDTALPVTQVAFSSGFRSLRRFNALFRERYRLSPTGLRRSAGAAAITDELRLVVSPRAPFDWPQLLAHLAPRAMPGVESVTGTTFRTTLRLGRSSLLVTIRPLPRRRAVEALVAFDETPAVLPLLAQLRRLIDADADPARIAADLRAAGLGAHGPLRAACRVPGTLDGFQAALRIVIGQQVSVRGATTLAGRVVQACAEPVTLAAAREAGLTHHPLEAARVAALPVAALRGCGLTGARAETVRALAAAVAEGRVALDPDADPAPQVEALRALPGVGAWTAQVIALRVLRDPDAWPAGDLVLRQRLGGVTAAEADRQAEAWRPWRAYAAVHLWAMGPKEA